MQRYKSFSHCSEDLQHLIVSKYESNSTSPIKKKRPRRRRRASTSKLELREKEKLRSHPILLTSQSFRKDAPTHRQHTLHSNDALKLKLPLNTQNGRLQRSLSIRQLSVNRHLHLVDGHAPPKLRKKRRKRPLSARSAMSSRRTFSGLEGDKVTLKKLRRRRPLSARTSCSTHKFDRYTAQKSVDELLAESRSNSLKKPTTIIRSGTARGSFMVQIPQRLLTPRVNSDDESSSSSSGTAESITSSPIIDRLADQIGKFDFDRKRSKSKGSTPALSRSSSAHHVVLKHQKRTHSARSSQKVQLIEHVYYMENRPLRLVFGDAQSVRKRMDDMDARRQSMWKLMMQNGQRVGSMEIPTAKRLESPKEVTVSAVAEVASDEAKARTSDLMRDMFVRHHSPKQVKVAAATTDKSESPDSPPTENQMQVPAVQTTPSPRKRARARAKTTQHIKVPTPSPRKVDTASAPAKSAKAKLTDDDDENPFGRIKGMKGAAFLMTMRAKLRLKQKKALSKLKKEVLGIYTENTPSIAHPDEFLRPISHESPQNASRISYCLKVFGRKRMRILTYIFKHIDYNKIGEISFDAVMQFDLLLLPQATRQMLFEDANLFFKFSGLQHRPWMNMLDWLTTWKLAVQKSGGFKCIDNFITQYMDSFREAKFRLNIIGITWP